MQSRYQACPQGTKFLEEAACPDDHCFASMECGERNAALTTGRPGMNDIAERSEKAREKLALALELLQQPEAGNLIDTVAEPVARSMAALHGIEESAGAKLSENAPLALSCIRQALGALQTAALSGASVEAISYIASSFVLVFRLSEQAALLPSAAKRVARSMAPEDPIPPPAAPSGGFDATMPVRQQASARPQAQRLDTTQVSSRPPPGSYLAAPSGPTVSSKTPPPPEGGMPTDALQIEVSLGAQSASNFYKGLNGNDIVKDGGLFVATYELPPLGAQLWLSVHMPGGYVFQALALVRWSRDKNAGAASVGFGCSFQLLSAEARKLIHRYARNREPLFYDA